MEAPGQGLARSVAVPSYQHIHSYRQSGAPGIPRSPSSCVLVSFCRTFCLVRASVRLPATSDIPVHTTLARIILQLTPNSTTQLIADWLQAIEHYCTRTAKIATASRLILLPPIDYPQRLVLHAAFALTGAVAMLIFASRLSHSWTHVSMAGKGMAANSVARRATLPLYQAFRSPSTPRPLPLPPRYLPSSLASNLNFADSDLV